MASSRESTGPAGTPMPSNTLSQWARGWRRSTGSSRSDSSRASGVARSARASSCQRRLRGMTTACFAGSGFAASFFGSGVAASFAGSCAHAGVAQTMITKKMNCFMYLSKFHETIP